MFPPKLHWIRTRLREEDSPWEPLHVSRGFKKEDNTLTVFFPNSCSLSIPMQPRTQGIVDALVNMALRSLSCLLVIPEHAKLHRRFKGKNHETELK